LVGAPRARGGVTAILAAVTVARALAALSLAAALTGCAQLRALWPFGDAEEPEPPPAPGTTTVVPAPKRGPLLLSGGGKTAGAVIAEAARLTGGSGTRVLILPLGVTSADAGSRERETWTRAGFTQTEILDATDTTRADAQIGAATFLWITGGDATRLLDKLKDGSLAEKVRARLDAGAVVGGTNLGAAAVAELMVVGGGEEGVWQGSAATAGGLGLWPGVIVEVQLGQKKRFNRLTAAVLDHPKFVGVGIDEGTGAGVIGTTLRVVGEGNVVVLDARKAQVTSSRPGDASSATGVSMQILSAGMTYDFAR
jgi:cyanophycinase